MSMSQDLTLLPTIMVEHGRFWSSKSPKVRSKSQCDPWDFSGDENNTNSPRSLEKNSRFVGSLPTKHFETYGGFFMGENCGRQEHCQSFVDGGGLWALCILLAEEAPRPLGWPRMASKKICFPIYQMSTDQFAKLGVVLSVVIGQLYTTSSKKHVFLQKPLIGLENNQQGFHVSYHWWVLQHSWNLEISIYFILLNSDVQGFVLGSCGLHHQKNVGSLRLPPFVGQNQLYSCFCAEMSVPVFS